MGTGLSAGTQYDVYLATEDGSSNELSDSDVAATKQSITTPFVCTQPSTAGYVYSGENAANCLLSTGTANTCASSLSCASGYVGTPSVTLCNSAGDYTVSGCVNTCTQPTTAGYAFGSVSETALTVVGFDVTGATCASGYVGTAVAAVCTGNSAAYVMSGCVNTCTRPTTAGYAFGSVSEDDLTVAGFDVTGATCASGYVGTAVAAVCTGNSAAYVMSGCNII